MKAQDKEVNGGAEMFDAEEFIAESIESLKATIDGVAIIACSGGVDSTVAAVVAQQSRWQPPPLCLC